MCNHVLTYSKKDKSAFWASVLNIDTLKRPYIWDRSLAVFHPSLLLLQNSSIDAEWFSRFVEISCCAVDLYGDCIIESNENLILDWIRNYYYLKNSKSLLLKDVSLDQIENMEKYLKKVLLSKEWMNRAILDVINQTQYTCLGIAWANVLQGHDIDVLPFSWLLEKIVSADDSIELQPLFNLAFSHFEGKVTFSTVERHSVMILDVIKVSEPQLIEQIMDTLLGIDSFTTKFGHVFLFFLYSIEKNEELLTMVSSQKSELFFNHIKSLISESTKWGKLSESDIIMITKFFKIQIKLKNILYNDISLQWALFFTISSSKHAEFLFNILKLVEAICFASDDDWKKYHRDELFYQTLTLFVIESKVEKLSSPFQITLECLADIAQAVPENILLEAAIFEDVNIGTKL